MVEMWLWWWHHLGFYFGWVWFFSNSEFVGNELTKNKARLLLTCSRIVSEGYLGVVLLLCVCEGVSEIW